MRCLPNPPLPRLALLVAAVASSISNAPCHGGFEYVEVGPARGILSYDSGPGYGTGVAAADYDDDGDVDLFVANGPGVPDQVYRNLGDGTFEEVAADLGLASTGPSRTALWLDVNGDGRLDLVVAGDCWFDSGCADTPTIRVHLQGEDGAFADVTEAFAPPDDGISDFGQHRSGLVAGDLDGDGDVDVVAGAWGGGAPLVLMNDAGTRFVDVAADAGFVVPMDDLWQPAILDVDRDGAPDVFWAVDFTENHLWINQGDGTFTDVAPSAGVDNAMNDMGVTVADYDADGDLDLYVTEIREGEFHNQLYRNDTVDGVPVYAEVSFAAGVEDTGFGWGCTFLDADLDGRVDLAVTNGWFNGVGYEDPSRLFMNEGDGPEGPTFVDRGPEVGFDDTEWGASLVAFDMDRDGDLDLAQTCNLGGPLRLLENRRDGPEAKHHFLTVKPRMAPPNVRAIGAEVTLEVNGARTTRLVAAGTSHLGQEPAEAHFGLGAQARADRLVIRWPDGAQTIRTDVAADTVLVVERSPCPGTADLDGDGAIDFADLLLMLTRWGPCPNACPHDVDADGTVGASDLVLLIGQWGVCAP